MFDMSPLPKDGPEDDDPMVPIKAIQKCPLLSECNCRR